ncbi:MAG TPA: rhodanese-like domain-containing protein, partial [Ktedonobacteraceae bacterium]|nr:rhodanese-like domain-containing protein [Ktedonobacteraceae bacterium]
MQKIILYYKFVLLSDPQMVMRWQRELCTRLHLQGRIIISEHGINGTLGGDVADIKSYAHEMNLTSEFKGIEYKWSTGAREDFPKLSIKVRRELVTLAPEEDFNVFDKGTPLRPEAWHTFIDEHPDVSILDARNDYESEIGAFKGAIKPKIKTFKDIKKTLQSLPKDEPVLTYCTGDIRCEYLSAYMKHKGFQHVYHLDGGIVKYGEAYGDDGHWEGKCYVFDKRM